MSGVDVRGFGNKLFIYSTRTPLHPDTTVHTYHLKVA